MIYSLPRQEQADPLNALAPILAARGKENPLFAAAVMGQQHANPLALLALSQGSGAYPYATIDDGDPRRGMFPTGQSQSAYTGSSAMARGIIETAQSLGMDPIDLATIISYETAGTFDPSKRGPTTQWGTHRGLIQFGEPQARRYGVNWDDPMGSQLGPDGAIARYYRANGWQPGMGIMDAYSIVNAGGPGLYHRSDANNGGAPGTVADKVNYQMAGHRQNALQLLGL